MMLNSDDISAEVWRYQKNVQRLRVAKGWDEHQLAREINASVALVRNLEAGRTMGSIATLVRLRKALRVSYDELFKE